MNNNIDNIIKKGIEQKEEISPFLFLGTPISKVNFEARLYCENLFKNYKIDKNNFFIIEDNEKPIKIEEIKTFLEKSYTKTHQDFQIFFIENISRLTIKAGNSLLKFLEEPGLGNLVFMTNTGENNILETILSRVHFVHIKSNNQYHKNEQYYSMLDNYIRYDNTEILGYFFSKKLEKSDYISFLQTFITYCKDNLVFSDILAKLEQYIDNIMKNNVSAKYIVDKVLLEIKK